MSSVNASEPDVEAKRLAEEKRVVRKVDWMLMPILMITLGLQYYDKAVLGSAAVFGILEDMDLIQTINGKRDTTRYSTVSAAFYYGYIVSVLPWALVFARFPLAKTCAICVFVWGLVCLLTVTCHNYPGFLVQRIFLGLTESAIPPAFVAVTGLWYKPYEQATRMGLWYSAYGLANMCSGLINFGLGHVNMKHPWKAMYYFGGASTMAWAFVIWFFLPDSPLSPGRFFNQKEKDILAQRFYETSRARDRQPFRWYQFKEAVLDIKTWIYLLMGAGIYVCNASVTAFGARIIQSWGFDSLATIALLIPGGFATCLTIWIFSHFADRYKDSRTWLLPLSCVPVWIGALVIWVGPWSPKVGPLIGFYLVASFGAPYVLLLTIATNNTAGATKKATTSGAIWIGYNVGNIASSYSVITQEKAIKYRSAWITVIVAMAFVSVASLVLRWMYSRENRRRNLVAAEALRTSGQADGIDAAAEGEKSLETPGLDAEGGLDGLRGRVDEDLTDKERPEFRYTL